MGRINPVFRNAEQRHEYLVTESEKAEHADIICLMMFDETTNTHEEEYWIHDDPDSEHGFRSIDEPELSFA